MICCFQAIVAVLKDVSAVRNVDCHLKLLSTLRVNMVV